MKVKDAPVGTVIAFGSTRDTDITWTKVSYGNDFISDSSLAYVQFDVPEFSNQSRARRSSGNNFYPHSNIAQWLNAEGEGWYRAQHAHDEEPYYSLNEGFLSRFDPDEIAALDEREITVAVPLGSRKEFGKTYTHKCKVWLPSAVDFGCGGDELGAEGAATPAFREAVLKWDNYSTVMTRSGIKDGGHIAGINLRNSSISMVSIRAYRNLLIHPMIRLKADTEISDSGAVRSLVGGSTIQDFLDIILSA